MLSRLSVCLVDVKGGRLSISGLAVIRAVGGQGGRGVLWSLTCLPTALTCQVKVSHSLLFLPRPQGPLLGSPRVHTFSRKASLFGLITKFHYPLQILFRTAFATIHFGGG